jgi:hypothetical protein
VDAPTHTHYHCYRRRLMLQPRRRHTTITYTATLEWTDASGRMRVSEPRHVSQHFYLGVLENIDITTRTTRIRYLEDEPGVRPVLVDDEPENDYQITLASLTGIVSLLIGAVLGWFECRRPLASIFSKRR